MSRKSCLGAEPSPMDYFSESQDANARDIVSAIRTEYVVVVRALIYNNSSGLLCANIEDNSLSPSEYLCCYPMLELHWFEKKRSGNIFTIFAWAYLTYKSYFFSQRTIFFSHTKSANSTFSHDLSVTSPNEQGAFSGLLDVNCGPIV